MRNNDIDFGTESAFYCRIIVYSILIFIIAIGGFMVRVKYVKLHPYNIPTSTSNQSTSVQKINILDINKTLSNPDTSVKFAFGVLSNIASLVFKDGGSNLYVEGSKQVNQHVIDKTYIIKDLKDKAKENKVTNLSELETLVSKEVMSDKSMKEYFLSPSGLGTTMTFNLTDNGNTLICMFKLSHK